MTLPDAVQQFLADHPLSLDELSQGLQALRRGVSKPFELVYYAVAFFVLLGALFDDRRDRTVLFWKSIPVSDTETVLSKLISAIWVAPLVTLGAIIVAQLFLLVLLSYLIRGSEHLAVATLWQHAGVIRGAAEVLLSFFTQGFWSLPLWGWLLLVSATAPRIPIIWAILVPIAPVLLEWAAFRTLHLYNGIVNHVSMQAFPTFSMEDAVGRRAVRDSSDVLGLWLSSDMWLGIAVGAALLWAAIHFRRRNNEL